MKNIMILSGAGLSAQVGLKLLEIMMDFGKNTMWWRFALQQVLEKILKSTWFLRCKKGTTSKCKAKSCSWKNRTVKEKWGKNLFVITQNVDDLLERAGCKDVVHLHGFLPELRCLKCEEIFNIGYEKITDKQCPKCKSKDLRHNIVMFEEQAPAYATLYSLLNQTSLFISIGTSGAVLPVGRYASMCEKVF